MKPINGIYVGWTPPESENWEPFFRTIRVAGGYQSDRTQLYKAILEKYPGLGLSLMFHPDQQDLPFCVEARTPLTRIDYEHSAQFLQLPYPNTDLFEYVGRTGGGMVRDGFTVCPVIEANADGTYSYESVLWGVDQEVRDRLSEATKLEVMAQDDGPSIVKADGRPLGKLLPHFAYLGSNIHNLRVMRTSAPHKFIGQMTLVSFNTSVSLYATPKFALEKREVLIA